MLAATAIMSHAGRLLTSLFGSPGTSSADSRRSRRAALGATASLAGLLAVLGCSPDAEPPASSPGRAAEIITFNEHVAPIVHDQCVPCHRSGELAPFSLVSYRDVAKRAGLIAHVTATRFMPPWLPSSDPDEFVGERRLTDEQIDLIRRWATTGAPEGDPSLRPEPPAFASGWQLGEPDLVVTMDEPYVVPAEGQDIFRNFVLAIPVERVRYVKGVELRPGNGLVVHHATMTIDRTDSSRRLDEREPGPGFDGMVAGEAKPPDGHFLGWTPGKMPALLPPEMGWRVDPGDDLVIQMHLLPSGKPESVRPSVGLYFTDEAPTRVPHMLRLGSQVIDIPAGEARYTIEDSYELPVAVDVLAVYPHAHYLATEMHGSAELPNGDTKRLIEIEQWDFNWQDEYRFVEPVRLPAGTRLTMSYVYDNSAANPRNPSRPPRRVVYGPRSTDEMGDLWIQVLPRRGEDLPVLAADFARKDLAAQAAGYEKRLRAEPGDPVMHNTIAAIYLALGRKEEARRHLLESIRLDETYAQAHNNLGYLYEREDRLADALLHYRLAVSYDKDSYKAHNNLANAYVRTNRLDEAVRHYRLAIAINPDYVFAHRNLAYALERQGKASEAATQTRIADRLEQR